MPTFNSDQERHLVDALVAIDEAETIQSLKADGILAIKGVLNCSPEEAQSVLAGCGKNQSPSSL